MIQKFTLLELNKDIQEKIKLNYSNAVWVIAEISELNVNRNGHCYLELIEKDIITDNIISKSRATIWAFTYRMLNPYFENATGHKLSSGIKILVQANVEFHELYGLSLNITDIDPNYTLGDLAQKKAEILKKLEEEGVLHMNKEISLSSIPQKIAIISSDTAAGYQDFINQLTNNSFKYKFYTKLFPAVMQGLQAENSIINSLEKIYEYEDFFDAVVIIRGGGSQSDLSCFNNYLLSANIAQFPLPVLTGIGHDKDESIVDLVAHKKLKTPTAVAEFLIEKISEFENNLIFLKESILDIVTSKIQYQKTKLTHFHAIIVPIIKNNIEKSNYQLGLLIEKLKNEISQLIKQERMLLVNLSNSVEKKSTKTIFNTSQKIQHLNNKIRNGSSMYIQLQKLFVNNTENKLTLLDPKNILKRGYSITYFKGKSIKSIKDINEDDEIITKLFSGFVRSKIDEKY